MNSRTRKATRSFVIALLVAVFAAALAVAPGQVAQPAQALAEEPQSQALEAGKLITQATDDSISSSWGLESIYAKEAQAYAKANGDNKPVAIAILDTGFYVDHEAIKGKVVEKWNAAALAPSGNQLVTDVTALKRAKGFNDVAPSSALKSDNAKNHGTYVASIASSVAPDAQIVLIRVGDDKGDIPTWALNNAYELILNQNEYDIRVINFSGGGNAQIGSYESFLYQQIDTAFERGIVTVCSSGNDAVEAKDAYPNFPSDYKTVVGVIGLARESEFSTSLIRDANSNFNEAGKTKATATKNISAPGKAVIGAMRTSSNPNGYAAVSGTSVAAPHVSGVLALMFSFNGELTASEAVDKLYSSATDIMYTNGSEVAGSGWDRYTGFGEVNAIAALGGAAIKGPGEIVLTLDGAKTKIHGSYSVIGQGANDAWTWSIVKNGNNAAVDKGTSKVYGSRVGEATLQAKSSDGKTTLQKTINIDPISFESIGKSGYPITKDMLVTKYQSTTGSIVQYTGSPLEPNVSVKLNGVELANGTDYTVSYSNNTNVSEKARFTITGKGDNFVDSKSFLFKISAAPIRSSDVTITPSNVAYTGSAVTPSVSVTSGGRTLIEGTDYDVTYSNNTKIGSSAQVKVVAKGNYAGTVTRNFTISKNGASSDSGKTGDESASSEKGKKNQTLTVTQPAKSIKVKYAKLKKKAKTLSCPLAISGAHGDIAYTKVSGHKKISIDSDTGKIKIKKRLKKGKYKVEIRVTAAGDAKCKSATTVATVTIQVK